MKNEIENIKEPTDSVNLQHKQLKRTLNTLVKKMFDKINLIKTEQSISNFVFNNNIIFIESHFKN